MFDIRSVIAMIIGNSSSGKSEIFFEYINQTKWMKIFILVEVFCHAPLNTSTRKEQLKNEINI